MIRFAIQKEQSEYYVKSRLKVRCVNGGVSLEAGRQLGVAVQEQWWPGLDYQWRELAQFKRYTKGRIVVIDCM